MNKHIILIGFKSVGKSAIGRELAGQIGRQFIDLDEQVEKAYLAEQREKLNCRQIMTRHGQDSFRLLELKALKQTLQAESALVIALGGGTPMYPPSREMVAPHQLIQITAPRNIVFERIMVNGRPAFFSPDEHPLESFNRIWEEREKVYTSLTKIKIDNSGSIKDAAAQIKSTMTQSL